MVPGTRKLSLLMREHLYCEWEEYFVLCSQTGVQYCAWGCIEPIFRAPVTRSGFTTNSVTISGLIHRWDWYVLSGLSLGINEEPFCRSSKPHQRMWRQAIQYKSSHTSPPHPLADTNTLSLYNHLLMPDHLSGCDLWLDSSVTSIRTIPIGTGRHQRTYSSI